MPISIYDENNALFALFPGAQAANLHAALNGECTLSLTVAKTLKSAKPGWLMELGTLLFDVVRVDKSTGLTNSLYKLSGEHVSYRLADMEQPAAVFYGTAAAVLGQILSGTEFTVGTVSVSGTYTLTVTEDTNKRDVLQQWVATVGGELQYSGMSISIVSHVGSSVRAELSDKRNVQSISVTLDSRSDTQTYGVALYRETALHLGDEVSITYPSLGLAVNSRIIAMDYDPFQQRQYSITCGEYVPNWTDSVISSLRERVVEGRSYYGTTISRDSGLEIEKIDPSQNPTYPSNSLFPSGTLYPGYQIEPITHKRVVLNSDTLAFYGNDGTMDFGWDNVSKHFKLAALTTEIDRATGVEQTLQASIDVTAGKIAWVVSGEQESSFTLTERMATLVAEQIDLYGTVTFSDLATAGETVINGNNITTGTISAERIDVDNIKVQSVYGGGTYANNTILTSNSTELKIGGDGSYDFPNVIAYAQQVKFTSYGSAYSTNGGVVINIGNRKIQPEVSGQWSLGDSDKLFWRVYSCGVHIEYWNDNTSYIDINSSGVIPKGTGIKLGSDLTTNYFNKGYIKTIYAESIDVDNIAVEKITVGSATNNHLILDGSSSNKSVTPETTNTWSFGSSTKLLKELYITDVNSTTLVLGKNTGHHLKIDGNSNSGTVIPETNDEWSIGSSTKYIKELFVTTADANKIVLGSNSSNNLVFDGSGLNNEIVPDTDGTWSIGSSTKHINALYVNTSNPHKIVLGSTTGHYLELDGSGTSRNIIPGTSGEWSVGSSTKHLKELFINNITVGETGVYGAGEVKLGTSAYSKLGFFGATVNTRQALSLSTTDMGYTSVTANNYLTVLNNLVGILKNKYGMIG